MFQVSHLSLRMQRTAVQRLEHVQRVDLTGSEARRDGFFGGRKNYGKTAFRWAKIWAFDIVIVHVIFDVTFKFMNY